MTAEIVRRDQREHGCRRLLNLGHTFAHALEAATAAPSPPARRGRRRGARVGLRDLGLHGAFHAAKPSDLLPELQGRLPIRVELRALIEADFVRILTETDNALTRQYQALMATEGVEVGFDETGVEAIARIAAEVNAEVENIGARRLYTVMERVFEELSFTAPDRAGEQVTIDAAMVENSLGDLAKATDVRRYVL